MATEEDVCECGGRVAASLTVESHSRPWLHVTLGAMGWWLLQDCDVRTP